MNPIKVFILGSCVSRDPFELADKRDFEVVNYYARTSFASLGSEAYVDEKILSGIDSKWQKRMVKADMDKSFFKAIKESKFDVLLIDSLMKGLDCLYTKNLFIQYLLNIKKECTEIINIIFYCLTKIE